MMVVNHVRRARSHRTHRRSGIFYLEYLREIVAVVFLLGMVSAGLQKIDPPTEQAATSASKTPVYNLGFVGNHHQFWLHGLHDGIVETDLESMEAQRSVVSKVLGPGAVVRGGQTHITTVVADCLGRLCIVRDDEVLVQYDARPERKSFPSVDISEDGNTVFGMLSEGGMLRWTWNGEEFKESRYELPGRHETMKLSDDGRWLAISTDIATVVIWDVQQETAVKTISEKSERVSQMCWSRDSSSLVLASDDGRIRLWNLAKDEKIWDVKADVLSCLALNFSQDDTRLVTGGFDKTVRVWDTSRGTLLQEFTGHTGPVRAIEHHPTEPLIISAGLDGQVRCWSVNQ